MKQYQWENKESIMAHNILYACTSEKDYDMRRLVILENVPQYGYYTVLEGGHCSCYDFDETEWEATEFDSKEELLKFLSLEDYCYGLRETALKFMKFYLLETREV